jgi:hypothetical protein
MPSPATQASKPEVQKRLGDPENLPSIEQAKHQIASNMTYRLEQYISEAQAI